MKSFVSGLISEIQVSPGLLKTVRLLGEFKGKESLYKSQIPQALDTLQKAAIIQSTESSNRIEGVTAPFERIQKLVADKTTPRNRSEQEILGYRDVLATIHANHERAGSEPSEVARPLETLRLLLSRAGVSAY